MADNKPLTASYKPADWDIADASAIQALALGEATEEQQKRALDWIIQRACATYDLSYRPDSDRDTAFAEGRRFVGLQLVKLLHINTASLAQAKSRK